MLTTVDRRPNPADNTVAFYTGLLGALPQAQESQVRLFMVPGMDHCGGGEGAFKLRHYRRDRRLGEQRPGARTNRRHPRALAQPECAEAGADQPPAVPLSADRAIRRQGRRDLGEELRLHGGGRFAGRTRLMG